MAQKAGLVEQIKSMQRSDPDMKQAWWDFCAQELGGVRDPNRHEPQTLKEFIAAYGGDGGRMPAGGVPAFGFRGASAAPARPLPTSKGKGAPVRTAPVRMVQPQPQYFFAPPMAAVPPRMAAGGMGGAWIGNDVSLAEVVKVGQRSSAAWKSAWAAYVAHYGSGFNDPAKYGQDFLQDFIDYLGELGAAALAEQEQPDPARKRAAPEGAGRPAKRARGADDEKAALVERVKVLQRSDPKLKEAWGALCDEHYKGVRDPSRHDNETLEEFLSTYEGS